MATWSRNRKITYSSIVIVFLVGVIGLPVFLLTYKAPTCFDGIKNGDEQGLDCGGSCQRLCQSAFLAPNIAWARFEQMAPGLYNIGAYIVNLNTDGEAKNVPYHFVLYDKQGMEIVEKKGTITIPPHRNTIAFQSAVAVDQSIPEKALFEFTSVPVWQKRSDPLSALVIVNKDYSDEANSSSLLVNIKNNNVQDIGKISVATILYDKDGNTIGFSKTNLDGIPANGTAQAPFTWPVSRNNKVISIEVLPVSE